MLFPRKALLGLVLIGLASCLSPNPRSCMDGLCTDQAFPFCDEDGSFAGVPQACIAVDCTPESFVRCFDDRAVSCNATGNDYEFDNCPNGCNDTTGCRTCSSNDQCTANAPICDATSGSCRTCAQDDECSSLVCEAGSCIAESGILYASSGGDDNSVCSKAVPCSPTRAFTLARMAAVPPTVRYLPGVYSVRLDFSVATAAPLSLVGSGATLVATNAITVSNGASVRIRGLAVTATSAAITCGDTSQPRSKLVLEDVIVQAGDTFSGLIAVNYCDATVKGADLNLNASGGAAIGLSSNANFIGDRVRVRGANGSVGGFGDHMNFTLTNSLIDHTLVFFSTSDSVGPGSLIRFGYNTLIGNPVDCEQQGFRTNVYDNNVVYAPNLPAVATGTNCRLTNNVLFPQPTAIPNNVSADPQLVNPTGGDYHLQPTSPAIDAAGATGDFPVATPDLGGTLRPQGAKPDVGAYERIP